jgi:hypothetical protein
MLTWQQVLYFLEQVELHIWSNFAFLRRFMLTRQQVLYGLEQVELRRCCTLILYYCACLLEQMA